MDFQTIRGTARHIGLGVVAMAAVTLVCYRLHLDLAIAGFLYLPVVVLLSQAGGFVTSVIVSLVAVACLDYFFTPPVLQLRISNPIDGVALATYLLTSLVVTRLASEAREKARAAERKQQALSQLYESASRLFSVEPQGVSGMGALRIFHDVLDVQTVCLFDGIAGRLEIAGLPSRRLEERTKRAYEIGEGSEDAPSRTSIQCLYVGGRQIGTIGFIGLSHAESLAAPLSMLASAALDRAQAFQAASAAAAASQAETLRTAIVDAFAHQFKTPLAAILAAAGGIRETRPLTPQQFELIEMIEVETLRLSRLATRALVTARLDREEVQPRLAPTNLADLIVRLVDQYPAEGRAVALKLNGAGLQVASDQELLTLALAQLLDNAFKYSRPNSEIEIALEPKDGMAHIRVRNQGSFIAPAERERIFERSYRAAATSRIAPGAGLGLYVARKIAHAHIGSLELEEDRYGGEGNTFCLKLPLLEAEPRHARKAS